jgi:hypothetical protein
MKTDAQKLKTALRRAARLSEELKKLKKQMKQWEHESFYEAYSLGIINSSELEKALETYRN